MIELETLQLFSDAASFGLAATLNLPAGCELRRCMDMPPELAEVVDQDVIDLESRNEKPRRGKIIEPTA